MNRKQMLRFPVGPTERVAATLAALFVPRASIRLVARDVVAAVGLRFSVRAGPSFAESLVPTLRFRRRLAPVRERDFLMSDDLLPRRIHLVFDPPRIEAERRELFAEDFRVVSLHAERDARLRLPDHRQ